MKIKYILTLIWYNIKSKKKSALSLFIGFLFVVVLIQAFLVYTTILDNEYQKIEKNDSDNYAIVYEDLDQDDMEYINRFKETEHIVSSSLIEILNFRHNTSMIVLDSNTYHYEDVSALKKLSVYHYLFKKNSEIFTSYELNKYDIDVLHSGRYPSSSDEIVISINILEYYGLEPEDVINQHITLSDGTNVLIEELYVSGILNNNYQADRAALPYNIFEIITYYDETRITEIKDEFAVDVYDYSEVYFNTYLNINETIKAFYDYFTGDLSVWYGGQANADMVVLLVNQSLFAKEMFALIGSILIFAMLISLMVSIIFRIKNQAIYISISHVYGMNKKSLLLSIYLELLVIYLAAALMSTMLSYGIFMIIDYVFASFFSISLIPSVTNLSSSLAFVIFLGVIIVSIYSIIVIFVIKQYKPISILRMSNRF